MEDRRPVARGHVPEWTARALPRVLIVDDDPALCRLLRNALVAHGYGVELAHTVADGRRQFDAGAHGVVMLDYLLPDGQGDELLDHILATRPDTLCIMMTGAQRPRLVTEWTRRGAAAFVSKPFDPAYLIELCKRTLRERELLRMPAVLAERMAESETLHARARDALASAQRLNAFQAQILKSVSEAVVVTDLDGIILYWGRGAEALYGYRAEEVLNQPYRKFAGTIDPVDEKAFRRMLIENNGWRGEHLQRRRDGTTFWSDVHISILKNDAGQPVGFIGIDHDLTDRKRAAEMLEQAQRLESVGRLAGGVAHDFNNMLSVILGNTELAMEGVDPSSPAHQALREIEDAAKHSAELTRQLLAFARRQTAQPCAMDLNAAVADALPMLRRLLGVGLAIEWRPTPDAPRVFMDPAQFRQIVTNLCVNARDAMQGQGTVTIESAPAMLDEATWPDAGAPCVPGDYAALAVRDEGCGMDRETLRHLFEPFFTTKALGKGTGLGLATVYGIVRQNHGCIHVLSEPGKGAHLTVYLPRLSGSSGTAPADPPAAAIETGRGLHVLLVEDEAQVRALSERRLVRLGHRVTSASSAEEALVLVETDLPAVDLLLTDIIMPGMNGYDLARALRARHPTLPCIGMSGYSPGDQDARATKGPKMLFLQKPFSSAELAERIERAVYA